MSLPAPRKNTAVHSATTPSDSPPQRQAGWDPFEVWRTRVLLPQLSERADKAPPAKPIQLARR